MDSPFHPGAQPIPARLGLPDKLEDGAELLWPEGYPYPAPPGAERMLAFTPERWRARRASVPLAFGSAQPSPFLPVQGT